MQELYKKIGNEIVDLMKFSDGDICDSIAENGRAKLSFSVTIFPEGIAGIKLSGTVKRISNESQISNQTKLPLGR